jgi:hypothetical protein
VTDIREQIADAKVQVAKAAIASPHLYPQWYRLCRAKEKLRTAAAELDMAQRVWNSLIEAAPDEWKKLAPIPE